MIGLLYPETLQGRVRTWKYSCTTNNGIVEYFAKAYQFKTDDNSSAAFKYFASLADVGKAADF